MDEGTQSAIILAALALVVIRFAFRELRERVIRMRTLWIRPALLLVLCAYLIPTAFLLAPGLRPLLVSVIVVAAAIGVAAGSLVVRLTSFSPTSKPNAVRAQGSPRTLAVWIAVLVLRLAARLFVPVHGVAAQLVLNCGTLVVITGAFLVIAFSAAKAIRETPRLGAAR